MVSKNRNVFITSVSFYLRRLGLLFIGILVFSLTEAQLDNKTINIHQFLLRLEQLQSNGDNYFAKGLFPSWREYAANKDVLKADDNIFYTGLIVFTLRKYYPFFSAEDKIICDSIIARAIPTFAIFKSRKGKPTYNFWKTEPPTIFPNSGFLNWFNKSKYLPDDADDTVIGLLALNTNDSVASVVHDLLIEHANLQKNKIINTYKKYRNIPAYSTWFGVKMPIDFDVGVLCNILYFIQQHHLQWKKQDSASFNLIMQVIKDKKYLTNAAYVSPHYHRTPVIMYHVSRLLSVLNDSCIDNSLRKNFINEVKKKFYSSKNIMDKIILNTCLMRLKQSPLPVKIPSAESVKNDIEQSDFIFFIGDICTFLPDFFRVPISKTGLLKFNFYCPAYNDVLLLENFVEQKEFRLNQ